jgi:hypothetical protein
MKEEGLSIRQIEILIVVSYGIKWEYRYSFIGKNIWKHKGNTEEPSLCAAVASEKLCRKKPAKTKSSLLSIAGIKVLIKRRNQRGQLLFRDSSGYAKVGVLQVRLQRPPGQHCRPTKRWRL